MMQVIVHKMRSKWRRFICKNLAKWTRKLIPEPAITSNLAQSDNEDSSDTVNVVWVRISKSSTAECLACGQGLSAMRSVIFIDQILHTLVNTTVCYLPVTCTQTNNSKNKMLYTGWYTQPRRLLIHPFLLILETPIWQLSLDILKWRWIPMLLGTAVNRQMLSHWTDTIQPSIGGRLFPLPVTASHTWNDLPYTVQSLYSFWRHLNTISLSSHFRMSLWYLNRPCNSFSI